MRGTHRGVWSSKGQRLIEAELFAAESKRSAQNGRALLCAANHASEIQGSSAAYKLKDARNRAPVPPVSLHISDVSAQRKVRGVKRGQETIWCPVPFCPCRWAPTPPGRRRRPKNALDGAYPRLLHQRCRNRRNREPVLPDRREHACAWQKILRIKQKASTESRCFVFWSG